MFGIIFVESSRHSPLSDHSSLFDSVSGTAINLGRVGLSSGLSSGSGAVGAVPVQLHGSHQRISSLARDARDLQPGFIKDSTMMRPVSSSAGDNSRPLNISEAGSHTIPELAEETVRGIHSQ